MIAVLLAVGAFDAEYPIDPGTVAPSSRTARAQPATALLAWPSKDPDETLDFGNDVSGRIQDTTDSIVETSAIVVDGSSGVTVVAHYVNQDAPLSTTTWLMGGVEGAIAAVRVRSLTVKGRRLDQTIALPISTR